MALIDQSVIGDGEECHGAAAVFSRNMAASAAKDKGESQNV
ncbi:hypothetical protein [Pseudodesulfovibrio alkaliphilus]|nr:hypothetical protein [Pseudodesulfovibrio alkaliphilus]